LLAETRALANKYPLTVAIPNSPINSLGYRQALQHLNGEVSLEEAIAAAQQAHRNYAKRQMTWFRRERDIHWLAGFGSDAAVRTNAIEIIEKER
jgi:tRNA dimethylallyltransferase